MIRKLASIRNVKEIRPIEGADMIELVFVDGWQCVSKKGEFKVGDLGCYFEIDSFLPEKPEYEFLRKSSYRTMADGSKGYRLKTIKLRGQLSQGLMLHLRVLNIDHEVDLNSLEEAMDISDLLGVQKYEAPIPACLTGLVRGTFPSFIKKTDQERIQNLTEYFTKYQDEEFELTEKLDGSSMTVYFNSGDLGVCSRGMDLTETENNSLWKVARTLELPNKLKDYARNIALQGEIIGEGIQGNPYKLRGQDYRIFDIWDISAQRYMTPDERIALLETLAIDASHCVPLLGFRKIFQDFKTAEELLEYANGESLLCKTKREGIVFKSRKVISTRECRFGEIISFKAVSNAFLLGERDE